MVKILQLLEDSHVYETKQPVLHTHTYTRLSLRPGETLNSSCCLLEVFALLITYSTNRQLIRAVYWAPFCTTCILLLAHAWKASSGLDVNIHILPSPCSSLETRAGDSCEQAWSEPAQTCVLFMQ